MKVVTIALYDWWNAVISIAIFILLDADYLISNIFFKKLTCYIVESALNMMLVVLWLKTVDNPAPQSSSTITSTNLRIWVLSHA